MPANSVGPGAVSNKKIPLHEREEWKETEAIMSVTLFFFAFDLTIHKLVFYLFTCADGAKSQYFYATEPRHRGLRLRYARINMHIKNSTPEMKWHGNMP